MIGYLFTVPDIRKDARKIGRPWSAVGIIFEVLGIRVVYCQQMGREIQVPPHGAMFFLMQGARWK